MTKAKSAYSTYIITAANGSHVVFLPERGGIIKSLIMQNGNQPQELLFLHDFFESENWHDLPGGWPFLFPVCARVERNGQAGNYLYDGKLYQMPMHGFAWRMPWKVLDHSADSLTMCLRDTADTHRVFPFEFELKLHYRISDTKLICEQTYTNRGERALPYYAGFHPYFLTPALDNGKEKVVIDYQPLRAFQYNSTYTDLIGEKKIFNLPTAITNADINEQLTKVGDNKTVKLIYPDYTLQIQAAGIEDPNLFPYVQLYTMPEKSFFCAEPWMGFPNAINTVSGVRWLQPGQSERGILTLEFIQSKQ